MTATSAATRNARLDRGAWAWALYEWARNPYVILCGIYVFAPYVSGVIIGDPVRGQQIISGWHTITGFLVAGTAPFLGAGADRMGRRKPLLALITLLLAVSIFSMWWFKPDVTPLWAIATATIVAGVALTWSEVLHNSMLKGAAPPASLSRVSGLGLALGGLAGVLLLVFVLFAWALPGQFDWSFLPRAPLFGLNAAEFEPSRIVAPLCAVWLVMFALPLFLYTPDLTTTGVSLAAAFKQGVARVAGTLQRLRTQRNTAFFLAARMFYADGKTAILIFSGIYAAGVMHWGLVEMLVYGVTLSVFAVFGGFAAGWLDVSLGPKRAVEIEIAVTLACLLAMVSMSPEALFFFIPVDPEARVLGLPIFSRAPELAYGFFSAIIAISITAAYGSSRSLMARLSPPGMEGELFGLYALSGSATMWLGPLLVGSFTQAYQSQKVGFASIALLLLAGLALLVFVKPPPADHETPPR